MALTEIPSELSSTPSIVDGGNATAITIDSSENVGIGQSTPKTTLNAAANNSGQGAILTLENTDTSITTNDVIGQIDFYANDSSTNGTGAKVNIKAIATSTAGTATALTFGTSSSGSATAVEAGRFDASGNLILKKNLVLESTSEGIDFSGVGSSAQTLGDYEEGTWTAAIPGLGITTNRANYTKIGRVVTLDFSLTVTSTGTSTSAVSISGIPYIASGNANSEAAGSLMLLGFTADTNTVSINTYVYARSGSVYMYQTQSNNAAWITVKANDFSINAAIIGSITYQTD